MDLILAEWSKPVTNEILKQCSNPTISTQSSIKGTFDEIVKLL
jgi:uncharacterized protein YaaN involved in tellurite resistance